jgi:DNA-directed RNA polymerase specialized sigma24 family protein
MTTDEILDWVDRTTYQAEPRLRKLSAENYLFELEDLRQVFIEAVLRAIPNTNFDKETWPAPAQAFLYKHGMWGVLHYIRSQANRGLQGICEECGWHGSFTRWCPECGNRVVGRAMSRTGHLLDEYQGAFTEVDFTTRLDIDAMMKKLTPAEKRLFVLVLEEGPRYVGFWSDLADELGISHVRVSQLRKRIQQKLADWRP